MVRIVRNTRKENFLLYAAGVGSDRSTH